MWLSHHWPEEYDRCVTLAGRHVCRRCLWFYPVCFATTLLSLAGLHWPVGADPWILWLASVPVVIEWWAEHRDWIAYSSRRQIVTSVLVAPAVGRGLARYLAHPGDHLWWAVVLTYAAICLIPVLWPKRPASPAR
jgi:hypothetical protein